MFVNLRSFGIFPSTGSIEATVSRVAFKSSGTPGNAENDHIDPLLHFWRHDWNGEETIIFVPLGIALARALKYDPCPVLALYIWAQPSGFLFGR
jgi:uncharacterized ion transporter superfamily protein YfcC